jgi:hypothetical protein
MDVANTEKPPHVPVSYAHMQEITFREMLWMWKCEKAFTYSSLFKNNERTHTGNKNLECKKYGKAFTLYSTLHTDEGTTDVKSKDVNNVGNPSLYPVPFIVMK